MNYYEFALLDWDIQIRHTFECDCSEGEFKAATKHALGYAINLLLAEEGPVESIEYEELYAIDGYQLLDAAVEHLQTFNGYKLIQPSCSVTIYRDYCEDGCPNEFPEKSWNDLDKHNTVVKKRLDDEWEAWEKEQRQKEEREG